MIGFATSLSARAAGAAVLHRRLRSRLRRHLRSARDPPCRRDQSRSAAAARRLRHRAGVSDRSRGIGGGAGGGRADRRPLRAAQSRRALAEQALAPGALRPARGGAARAVRSDVNRVVGRRRAPACRGGCRARGRRGAGLAAGRDCRPCRARARRAVMVSGDTGPIAHRGGGRHADRRHLRADAAGAQRPLVAGRRDRVARRRLPVPSPAPLPAADDVPARHCGCRRARRRRSPAGGG